MNAAKNTIKNVDLETYDTKNIVIDYLFNTIDSSKYKYRFLSSMDDLKFLKENQLKMCLI